MRDGTRGFPLHSFFAALFIFCLFHDFYTGACTQPVRTCFDHLPRGFVITDTPEALIFNRLPIVCFISCTASVVAPPPQNPVEVLTKWAPPSAASWHPLTISSVVRRPVSKNNFYDRAVFRCSVDDFFNVSQYIIVIPRF